MNTHALAHDSSLFSGPPANVVAMINGVRNAWTQVRSYRNALSELQKLSDRELDELDLTRGDLREISLRESSDL